MRQLLLSVLAAILVLAQSFGPRAQSFCPPSQGRLNKLMPLMSVFEDAPSVEVLTIKLLASEALLTSKQSEIETLKESMQSVIETLKESMQSVIEILKESKQSEIEILKESKKSEIASKQSEIERLEESKKSVIASKQSEIASKQSEIASKQSVIASKQSEIERLEESKKSEIASKQSVIASKQSEIERLEESKKSEIDVWKKLSEEQDRTITKLEMELTTTMADNLAIEYTRIIIEYAAIKSKPGTATDATMALSTELFKDGNINSNKLCDVGKQWLAKLVSPDPLTPQLEKTVCAALRQNTFRTLSKSHHHIANAPVGLYLGVGLNPDRYAQALLVLKAQFLGTYYGKVTLLSIEKKPIWILVNADLYRYQADSTDVAESSNEDSE